MNLIEQVKQIMAREEISQVKLSRELGCSNGALSAYLKGNYSGDSDKIGQMLTQWLERRSQRLQELMDVPDFIETLTAKEIHATINYARVLNRFTIIYGMSGVGKTCAAQAFKRANPHNVWMVTASPARASLSEILYEIALELGMQDAPRRKGLNARLISKKLMGTSGLLIIDEADHLAYDALEELRILQEETQIGMVLIGNDKVYTRLRGARQQAHEFARLWSRVARRLPLEKCKTADVTAIANAWHLDTSNKELMKLLNEISGQGGGLRSLTQTLRLAGMYAKAESKLIDLPFILQAKQELTV